MPKLVHSLLGRIAGNQGRVDGADRNAGGPVGVKARLGKRLVDATLIGAERAAALQQQRDHSKGGLSPDR